MQPPNVGLPGQRWHPDQRWPGVNPHAAHEVMSDLPEASHHGSWGSIRALSLPGGSQFGHGCGSGVGDRHHLHPAPERVCLPGGDHESLFQEHAQLETLQQP